MTVETNTGAEVSMRGGGYYSQATIGAKDVIDRGTPLILEVLAAIDIPDDGTPFTVADIAAADGGTSMTMISRLLAEVRRRAPSRPIQMVYTDLPHNDFSQVFLNVHGNADAPGFADDIDDLFVFASAASFHDPILAPGTLNFGFSATAMSYLSEKPGVISNHIHMVGATGPERDAFVEQGRRDWERILLHRARELSSGGRLVLFNSGIDEEGRYLGATGGISMYDTYNEIWADLVEENIITRSEYVNTNFPQCYRTVEQFTAPLLDTANSVHAAGLRLEHVETRILPCPYKAAFDDHGDAATFARDYIPTLRSWSETMFASGLSDDRSLSECQAILDRFYDTYEARVRDAPDGHGMDYVHCHLVISKV
jgi:hypothetical protein